MTFQQRGDYFVVLKREEGKYLYMLQVPYFILINVYFSTLCFSCFKFQLASPRVAFLIPRLWRLHRTRRVRGGDFCTSMWMIEGVSPCPIVKMIKCGDMLYIIYFYLSSNANKLAFGMSISSGSP